jgi:Protein of unknown function (DUF1168)
MSEPGRESIPTSTSKLSQRPIKKRPLTAIGTHASQLDALFARPDRPVEIPEAVTRTSKTLPPPPEIVANVQGSSAGAGSGEFHVYKASRRREYERVRLMEEEVVKEEADKEWEEEREQKKKRDAQKTNKNKARRDKAKARKDKAKHGDSDSGHVKEKKVVPAKLKAPVKKDEDDEDDNDTESIAAEQTPVAVVEEVGIIIHDDD